LAQPIKSLASRIKRVAAGDLEHKIALRMRDEMGELVRSFNEMVKKLRKARDRERLSAIGEAVAWITHELKNSLVSIKSFIQMVPQKHKDEKFVDRFSRLMPEEVQRMERIFKELADFSSTYELKMARTDLKEIIDHTLEIMKEEFINRKIDIKYSAPNHNFCLQADPEKLKQVFMNLLINSLNAMPAGGALTISLGVVRGKSLCGALAIEVKIQDTGEGMSRQAQEKIFEPFHTTKDGGMGLGLTISRRIVQQHGGEIRVESSMGAGTTFTVSLPSSA
jgi:two-component system NtrC family sensor kinase